MPEREVVNLWQRRLSQRQSLTTTAGERLEVVYPGRASGDGGPDFRDAVIVLGGKRQLKGDIELHVNSGQWWQHGHHLHSSYHKVVLHVVLWDDGVTATHLQDRALAPMVALGQLDTGAGPAPIPPLPCRDAGQRLTAARIEKVLSEAGEARFQEKASRFRRELQHQEPDQVLYQGLLEALGYSKNKGPFLALAQALSWRELRAQTQGIPESQVTLVLQALLLGRAGLLPSQRGLETVPREPWAEALEMTWRRLCPGQWGPGPNFYRDRVRPENLPARRLAGAGLLLSRYLEAGLTASMVELVAGAESEGQRPRLAAELTVAATGFWASHLDFGLQTRGTAPALIGQGRAGDMVVNVVLPFVWAWAGVTASPMLQAKALGLYRGQPKLQDNGITRHMMQQLAMEGNAVTSAAQQQGLLHIYKAYCTQGGCQGCQFSRA